MDVTDIKSALGRVVPTGRALAAALKQRAQVLASSAMRASSMMLARVSPEAGDGLALAPGLVSTSFMGKADLEAVLERRTEIAREIAALEEMRSEMEAENQELLVAERVLRRLAESPRARTEAPARLAVVEKTETNEAAPV